MHPEEFLAAIRRRPFIPLRLHVSDGTAYELRHPEMAMVTRRSVILAISDDPKKLADRSMQIDVVHITRLEQIDSATPANGQQTE